jgi:hypothetical protein
MALNPLVYGDNPCQPGISAQVYLPDQLVAGTMKIVTDSVTISGAAPIQRGTIMGMATQPTLTSSLGKTAQASDTITVIGLPADGDTITILGTVLTWKAIPSGQTSFAAAPGQLVIPAGLTAGAASYALVAQALTAYINTQGQLDVNIAKITSTVAAAVSTLKSIAWGGTVPNAYTLATSNSSAFTVGAATFANGVNNTGTETVGTISGGPNIQQGNYLVTLTSATQGNVINPAGDMIGVMTMGTQFTTPEVSFLVTTGGSPAAGENINLYVSGVPNVWKVCTGAAGDGSSVPRGILVDYADPSAGNVIGGMYLVGEFNINAVILDPSLNLATVKTLLRAMDIYLKTAVPQDMPA